MFKYINQQSGYYKLNYNLSLWLPYRGNKDTQVLINLKWKVTCTLHNLLTRYFFTFTWLIFLMGLLYFYLGTDFQCSTHHCRYLWHATERSTITGWKHQREVLLSVAPSPHVEFQGEESHWCLLDLSGLHIHKEMEKMDTAWCSIRSNLIFPLSLSPSLSVSSTPHPHPPRCTHRPPQQAVRVTDSRATVGLLQSEFRQSLLVSILHQQAATQWLSHERWWHSATHIC